MVVTTSDLKFFLFLSYFFYREIWHLSANRIYYAANSRSQAADIMYDPNEEWLGKPADKAVMLQYLNHAFSDVEKSKLHYVHAYPGTRRSAESLYTLRICNFEFDCNIHAAFDGVPADRAIKTNDILLGSYNGINQVLNAASTCYGGVSIIFHTHHIRLHYSYTEYGKIIENHYYYAPAASGALLHIAQGLDSLIHSSPGEVRDACCRALLKALLLILHAGLPDVAEENHAPANPLVQKLKYYIENNFCRMINCSMLCDELQINRSYASKLFHDNYGITMNNYLLNLRLEAAGNLLKSQENLKVSEIAQQCAFQDPGYFIRVFRKHYGCTPNKFRHRHRKLTDGFC